MTDELTTRIQVLALTDSGETTELLMTLLSEDPSVYLRTSRMAFGEGSKAVARHEPQVIVVVDTIDDPAAAVEELDTVAPGVPVLAILPESDLEGVQDCTLAGARGTLFKPFDHGSLLHAIQQVYIKELRRKQHLASSMEAGPIRPQRPRIIAVHGAKGGVGATTIAANMAASLHRLTGRRVMLFDGDLLSNDAGVLCDISSSRTLADLLPVVRELDADLLDSLVAKHPSGIRVLLAPEQLQRAEAIRGEDMQRALTGVKPYFDFTIVDTASRFTPVTLAALDEADMVVLVVTPEVVALRDAARFIQLAIQLGYPAEKVTVVVNRANAGKGITPGTIEQQLQRSVVATIPSDGKALVECMNVGELIVESRPGHKVSSSIKFLAQEIATRYGWNPQLEKERAAGSASPHPGDSAKPASNPFTANGANGTAPAKERAGQGSLLQRFLGRGAAQNGQAAASGAKS